MSFLEFQVNEIEAAHLVKEEYEQLEAISAKLQNATKITHAMESINYLMSDIIIASVCTLTPEKEYGAGAGGFCRLRHYEY